MFLSDAQQAYGNETSDCISAVHRLFVFRFLYISTLPTLLRNNEKRKKPRLRDGGDWKRLELQLSSCIFSSWFFFGGGNFKRKMTCSLGVDH